MSEGFLKLLKLLKLVKLLELSQRFGCCCIPVRDIHDDRLPRPPHLSDLWQKHRAMCEDLLVQRHEVPGRDEAQDLPQFLLLLGAAHDHAEGQGC